MNPVWNRSLFWPAVLILAGIIALLVNTGEISVERIGLLVSLWPVILIVIGLEIIARRAVHGPAADVAAALIVVVAIAGAVAYVAVAPNPGATHTVDASGPAGSFEDATAEINVGAATIEVTGTAGMSELYRAHVEYTGAQPRVHFDDSSHTLRIDQTESGFNFFPNRQFNLTLQLNSRVRWAITENTGAATTTYNLAQLRLSSLQINTGASKDDITLGTPSGTVPVEVDGGALTVRIHRPSDVSASVDVSGGAISLDVDGRSSHAFGQLSGSVSGGSGSSDGYQIKVNGGACTVSLDTASSQ